MGVEDSESEHGDTDEEAVDDSEHEEQSNTEEDEEMDDDNVADNNVANNDVANNSDDEDDDVYDEDVYGLVYLINDITSIHDYCIGLRKEYRKALKQLNDLDEYDKKKAIESYAKLEVRVKDDLFGIENEVDEKDDDVWDFVFKFRNKLELDTKLLNNYVAVEKTKLIIKKNIDDD